MISAQYEVEHDGVDADTSAPDFDAVVFDEEPPELSTRLVLDVSDIIPWQAPRLSMELDLDHVLGGGVHDVVAPPSEGNDPQSLDRQIARLPIALRRPIESLQASWHRQSLFDAVEKAIKLRVGAANLHELVVPGELFTQSYIPEIHRRAALRTLANDRAFLQALDAEASQIKGDGHLVRVFGNSMAGLPTLPPCALPGGERWEAESWLGLAKSSMPEALPEEVICALAQRALRRYPRTWGRRPAPRRILHWGALNSVLAMALQASAPGRADLEVCEVDTVGQIQSMPRVRWRSTALPAEGVFDDALIHFPPPGLNANNIRSRYKDLADPTGTELHVRDIGRLGPRKWRRRAIQVIRDVLPRVKPYGEVVLAVPTSVRTTTRNGRFSEWCYASQPELAEGFEELLQLGGWHVTHSFRVVEMHPQPQPFFITRRCSWRLMIASQPRDDRAPSDLPNVEDVFL